MSTTKNISNKEIYLLNKAYNKMPCTRDYFTITLVINDESVETVIWSEENIAKLMGIGIPAYTAFPNGKGKYTKGQICHLMPNGHIRTNRNEAENDNIDALPMQQIKHLPLWILKLSYGELFLKNIMYQ